MFETRRLLGEGSVSDTKHTSCGDQFNVHGAVADLHQLIFFIEICLGEQSNLADHSRSADLSIPSTVDDPGTH